MSACSAPSCEKPKTVKRECPICQQLCLDVQKKTILHHVKEAWLCELSDERYFFCRTIDCEVVYFSNNDNILKKTDIRTRIGIKEQDGNALICYCFGVDKEGAAAHKKAKYFVIAQTKESSCTCETTNPSGRCCLKDFPKFK